MIKKLLNLKIRFFIFTLLFMGAISIFVNTAATTNYSFSLLKTKVVVAFDNNTSNIYGEDITLSNNLSLVNYIWADTPTAEAGFKEVFQKIEVLLLKGEVLKVAMAPIAICKNITVCLDASGNATIAENAVDNGSTGNGTLSFDTNITTFTTVNIGANYVILSVTDADGTTLCNATVTVLPNFTPGAIINTGESICYNGNPAIITSTLDASGGDGNITYQWKADGVDIVGATSVTYDPPAGLTANTTYTRWAIDNICNTTFTQSTGDWVVTVRPNFTSGAINITGETICYSGNPTLIGSATASNGGDNVITYKWQANGSDIASSNSATFDPPTNLTTTTTYTRWAKDDTCNTTFTQSTGSWLVTVRPNFTSGAINTTGETICYNGNPSVIGSATDASGGDGTITYQWEANGLNISGATGATYDPPSGLTTATTYTRKAKDNTCNLTFPYSAGSWVVTVNPNVTPTFTAVVPICNGGSLSALPTTSNNGITGTWSPTLNNTATTTYTFTPTTGLCATTASLTITVNAIPTITGTTPASRCGSGTVGLGAAASAGITNWYAASTGGASLGTGTTFTTPSISTTTTYYVDATDNGCTTAARTAVTATVNPIPTITGTTPASRCGTGIVGLSATTSSGTINWYATASGGASLGTGTTFTTPIIAVTTTYYVDATDNGCTTAARTAVTATVNAIPTITGTTPAARCGAGTVVLGATASAGIINWYAAATGGASLGTGTSYTTPSISSTATYYVDATNNGCTTATRTAVVATVNAIPTITGTTASSRCGTGTVGLGAIASAGTINWYAASTGGVSLGSGTSFTTTSISATTTYYVDATENGCTTAARTAVTATVNAIPTITGTTPGNICVSGSTILSATASAGTINWYAASTGGSSLGSGTNYTTPNLSSSTTYYVDATVNGCTTGTRTAVTATVNAIPTIISTTPSSRCNNGIVTLSATASAGTVNWYAAATGGSILASGASYSPNITATTTYYVAATIAGCTTGSRTPVVATRYTLAPTTGGGNNSASKPTGPTSICPGLAATGLTYNIPSNMTSTAESYVWNLPPGFTITSGLGTNQITVSVLGPGAVLGNNNISVTAYNPCGNSGPSSSLTVNIGSFAGVNVGPDFSMCIGNNPTLMNVLSGNATDVTWAITSGTGTISGGPYPIPFVYTPSATGTVTLTATTNTATGSCSSSVGTDQVIITVNQPPAITAEPTATQTLCSGSTANFSVTATGTGLSYQWRKNGTNISGATSNTYSVTNISTADAGTYSVEVSGTSPCLPVTSQNAVLNVNQAVAISTQPTASQTLCSGNTANFSVTATGTGLTYQWRKNGTNISGATSNTYSVTNISTADAGTYSVEVSGTSPCLPVTSQNAVLNVNQAVAISTQPTASQTLCSGNTANFSVAATGDGLTYQWRKNGTNISGATSNTYSISNLITTDAGTYSVVVSGASPCLPVTSQNAVLNVNQTVAISTQPTASQTLCSGNTANFSVAATGTGLTYQWRKNGTPISGATSNTYSISNLGTTDAGTYSVEVSGTSPCLPVTSQNAVLNVNQAVAISTQPTASQTLCSGNTANFSVAATGDGLTYQWTKNGTPISGATSNTYSITNISTTDAATYSVVVSGTSPCTPITSQNSVLNVNQAVVITAEPTATQTVCSGFPVSFTVTATGTSLMYQWKKGGTNISGATSNTYSISNVSTADAGNYTVEVSGISPCGPVTSSISELIVNQDIDITSHPSSQITCEGNNTSFTVAASGTISSYVWRKNGVPVSNGGIISGATTATITFTGVAPSNADSYDVVISSPSGTCSQTISNPAVLTVNTKSVDPTSASASVPTICSGGSTVLNLIGGGGGTGEVIKWYTGSCGGTLVGTGNGLSVSPTTTTTYYGRYEDAAPCSYNSACVNVTVIVNDDSTLSLTSVVGTDAQIKCIATAITPITYSIGAGGTGVSITAGALPTGVTGVYSGGIFTISGTPSVAGIFNYTVTTSGPCTNFSLSGSITITALPSASINYALTSFCSDSGTQSVTLTGTNAYTGGTYSAPAGLTINALTGAITPSTSSAGTYTVTYTIPASGGCGTITATTSVIITSLPTATISYGGTPYCKSISTDQGVTRTGTNAFTGGTYTSSPAGLSIDGSSGAITPSASNAGTYTVTYTIPASGGCVAIPVTTSVNITAIPIVTFNYGATAFCMSASNPVVSYTGGGVAGVFTATPAGLSINASTGAINLVTSTIGTYTVTNTIASSGGCATATHSETIIIHPVTVAGSLSGYAFDQSGNPASPIVYSTNLLACEFTDGNIELTGNIGAIIRWESSSNGGVIWTTISNTTNSYPYSNIPVTTIYRAVIQSGNCEIAYSNLVTVSVVPQDIKPNPVIASNTTICLGGSSTFTATSGYGTGQFITGGDFNTGQLNTQDPNGWLVNGSPGGWTANADTSKPSIDWSGTNGPKNFGGTTYDTYDNSKFGIVYGIVTSVLETPIFNTFGLTNAELEFYQAYFLGAGSNIKVELSTNGGSSYPISLQNITGSVSSGGFIGLNYTSIDLSNYVGQSQLRIRFTFTGVTANSTWALESFKLPTPPIGENIVWTDENQNIISTTTSYAETPTSPGIHDYYVTSYINGCVYTITEANTVKLTINVNFAYAGKEQAILIGDCGNNRVTLNAYDNRLSADENIAKGAWDNNYDPDDDPGTGATGQWTIKSGPSACGTGTFSDDTDPDATFTGNSGDYVLTWTAGGCSSDVQITLTDCASINFDGINDNITFKNNYNLANPFSIEVWVKPNSISGVQTIFSKRDANNLATGYDLKLSGSTISFNWNAAGTIVSPYPLTTSRWYHIAVTFTGGAYRLYIDGIEVAASGVGQSAPGTNNLDCILGAMDQTGSPPNKPINYFSGWMDELRIWNVALTPEQLHQMMNQEIRTSGPSVRGVVVPIDVNPLSFGSLLGYYKMDLISCGYLNANVGTVTGKLRNIEDAQTQNAPIPYTTKGNGNWNATGALTPWTFADSVWDYPNSKGYNNIPIDWNIVRTGHNIISNTQDIKLLGLLVEANKLTITGAGAQDENNAGNGLWITHYLKLDGNIDLVGESQLVQKRSDIYTPTQFSESILDIASGGYLKRDQQGTTNLFNYNYWGSPVGAINTTANNVAYSLGGNFRDGTTSSIPNTISWTSNHNATGSVPITLSRRWIYTYANKIANTYSEWDFKGETGTIAVGLGFTMKGSGVGHPINNVQNYSYIGKPNNNTINIAISNGNNVLVGNPYPSAIDSEKFIIDNGPGAGNSNSIIGALYFWEHYASNNTHILRDYVGGYAVRNLTTGIKAVTPPPTTDGYFIAGGNGIKIPGKYVPVGQGFFVFSETGGSVTFKNSQRVFERETTNNSQNGSVFFKSADEKSSKISTNQVSKEESQIQLIRLEFEAPNGAKRPLALGFIPDNKATDGVDYGYDAKATEKLPNDMSLMINNERYVIQGVGAFDETKNYPVGIFLTTKGNVKISVSALENIEPDVEIYIKDSFTGETYKINKQPFEISLEPGEYLDRFALVFQPRLKTLSEIKLAEGIFTYMNNKISELQITKIVDTEITGVTLFNYLGQTVKTWNSNFAGRKFSLPINAATGVYIVQINTIDGTVNKKIIIE